VTSAIEGAHLKWRPAPLKGWICNPDLKQFGQIDFQSQLNRHGKAFDFESQNFATWAKRAIDAAGLAREKLPIAVAGLRMARFVCERGMYRTHNRTQNG
jgi:hypothetical protein